MASSVCNFVKCGLCEWLRLQIESTPRSDATLLSAYKYRLGKHFQFQAAQRLQQARIEESCCRSNGRFWFMKVDRMEARSKTQLPTVHSLARTPLLKQGARIIASIIGSQWSGPTRTQHLCRTAYQDMPSGSETQCSAVLLNLHAVATREGHLPEQWCIGADNTPKETKNAIFMSFVIWLLCVLDGTALWMIFLVFLIVGHTHDKLDRFFSRLSVALAGKDFLTEPQMWSIIKRTLQDDVDTGHVTAFWNFKSLQDQRSMPRFSKLGGCHALRFFRKGGVYVQWNL